MCPRIIVIVPVSGFIDPIHVPVDLHWCKKEVSVDKKICAECSIICRSKPNRRTCTHQLSPYSVVCTIL